MNISIVILSSILGSSVIATLISWVLANISKQQDRELAYLKDQLTHLYGPICFLTSQNDKILEHVRTLDGAKLEEYYSKEWSQDSHTQNQIDKEISNLEDKTQQYLEVLRTNNENILSIIKKGFHHIDPEDIENYQQFITDFMRFKIECKDSGALDITLRIYLKITQDDEKKSISWIRPGFIQINYNKFIRKKEELQLSNWKWWLRDIKTLFPFRLFISTPNEKDTQITKN